MRTKRGSEKYYIIISLILGLMVLGLSLYFIFHEYFTQEDIDWEICRQSIVLRTALPEASTFRDLTSLKRAYPLKCKTFVTDIRDGKAESIEKTIAEVIGQSWHLVGEGEGNIFPVDSPISFRQHAVPCMVLAKISMSEELKKEFGSENISIERALQTKTSRRVSYWDYLNPSSGEKAFNYFKGWGDSFEIDFNWEVFDFCDIEAESFIFPRYFDPGKGDLFVIYAEPVRATEWGCGGGRIVKSYFILVQEEDFDKLNQNWLVYMGGNTIPVCTSYETIPA